MVTIKVGRKEFLFGVALLVVVVVAGFSVAYGGDNPVVMGHSGGEIEALAGSKVYLGTASGSSKDIQTLYNSGEISLNFVGNPDTAYQASYTIKYDSVDNSPKNYWLATADCERRGGRLPSLADFKVPQSGGGKLILFDNSPSEGRRDVWTSTNTDDAGVIRATLHEDSVLDRYWATDPSTQIAYRCVGINSL